MRTALPALLLVMVAPFPAAAAPAPATVSAPAPALAPTTFEAFDSSIEQTKQAMMADPEVALQSALAATRIASRLPASRKAEVATITADWLHGEALIFLNRLPDASPIIDAALERARRFAPNTKLHGDLLRSHGAIAAATGSILAALNDYQHAHDVFRKAGVARSQALVLQDIGQIYWDAGDYARSLDYYEQSDEAYDGDRMLTLTLNNSRAEVFRKMKRYADAKTAFEAALKQARTLGSPLLETRILTNLAGSEAEAGHLQSAQAAIDRAIALSRHGEAAGWRPFVFGVAARIAFQRGDLQSAQRLVARTFDGIDLKHSEMLYREYHRTAAQIYEATGDEPKALAHYKAFQRLDSEAQKLTASIASQLLGARFDFANQNLKISNLKRGQLQRDIALERQKSRFQITLLIAILGASAIVLGVLAFGLFSVRRSRNQVRDANTNLSLVNSALEVALKAKTEFLATTSHEIRTPLNGILGMTQVLLADRRIQSDIRERIEVVHGAGETMCALVDDILDVAKMESGKLVIERQETDLPKVLRDVARLWSGHAQAKKLDLIVDIDEAPRAIMSDPARLRQIVFNLMSNAVKFTEAGTIRLHASTRVTDDASELLLAVSDTGVGIAQDKLESIFEAFSQVDGGVTRQFSGTGLGLAICRNLATAMGGEVAVDSLLGQGTTFTVRLPLEEIDHGGCAAESGQAECEALARASLLIVDSDPETAMMLRLVLATDVASTEVAATIEDAIAQLKRGEATLVLVDSKAANDPVRDLHRLASAATDSGALLSLLVSASEGFSIADAIMIGGDQVIAKPADPDALAGALRSLYGAEPQAIVLPETVAA